MTTATLPAQLLTPPEAAEFLSVSLSCLAKWRCYGTGPAYCRAGRSIRYRVVDLERWLRDRTVAPVETD